MIGLLESIMFWHYVSTKIFEVKVLVEATFMSTNLVAG